MSKLPVFATVGRAYSFVFKNLGLLYRLCWFPVLISGLPQLVSFDLKAAPQELNPFLLAFGVAVGMIVFLVQFFFVAMALVAIHRVILFGDRKPGTLLLFSVGRAEFYFTAVPLVLQLGGIGIVLLASLVFGWPTGESIKLAPRIGLPLLLAFFAIWALWLWVFCRFVAFYPLVVVTERLPIRDSWRLSSGNFWRIFGVFFFGSLPMIVVVMIAAAVLMPFIAPLMMQAAAEQSIGMKTAAIGGILNVVLGIPLLALGVAFLCYSFKALTGYAPDEVVPSGSSRARSQ